jgi:tRNA modification GTPase
VLFDCAGLIESPDNVLDELMQQAAVEALANSAVVVFCVDISQTDHSEDAAVLEHIDAEALIAVATKSELLAADELSGRLEKLSDSFDMEFIALSSHSGRGIELLTDRIDEQLTTHASSAGPLGPDALALTARHRQMVTEAVENLTEAARHLKEGGEEVAAMMLRAAWQGLAGIERENIDEQILSRIFERFCIGK